MQDVTIAEAKDKLEDLVSRATRGEIVRITDARVGTVRLTPIDAAIEVPVPERRPGRWKGRFVVPERLFEPLTDDEMAWLSREQFK